MAQRPPAYHRRDAEQAPTARDAPRPVGALLRQQLQRLSKRVGEEVETDERVGQAEEGGVKLGQALVAQLQAAVLSEPGQRALHYPAVVPQALVRLVPFAGD